MERILLVVGGIVVVVLLSLLCRCCCSGSRGRVIAPPAANTSAHAPAPYPQQQYAAPYIAAVPVASAAPTAYVGAPGGHYPTHQPAPAMPGPWAAPYPPAHSPAASAPAPADAFSGLAPPGWSAQACPPSYEQVMAAQLEKQPPYNPSAPH